MNRVTVGSPAEQVAMLYLEDQAYSALLNYKEPVRSADIIGEIGNDKYSTRLIRHVLASSSRFAQIDRRWDLDVRYEDKQRPLDRILKEVVEAYGRPMTIEQTANELASVYDRSGSFYESVVLKLFRDETRFFGVSGGLYGVRSWLLDSDWDTEDDVLFYNNLSEEDIKEAEGAAGKVDWTADDIAAVASSYAKAVGGAVSNKIMSFFRWRAKGEAFNAISEFDALYQNSDFVWLSDQHWAAKENVESYNALLDKLADTLAEEIIEEAPAEVVERAEAADEVAPTLSLTISERDLDEVVQIVSAKGEAKMPAILESIFEISPRDPIYSVAAEGLSDAMRQDGRFVWVGTDRWRMSGTIPEYVNVKPSRLDIPVLYFESLDGERIDVELEDEGLEGGLDVEIHNPLVQDVNDCDAVTEQDELPASDSARCVVTKHHVDLGTFPLCQIPHSFLPAGPHLIELTLIDGDKRSDVWVNRETGLLYGMEDVYADDMPESGAVFTLVKTPKADEFEYVYKNETDPLAFVSANRIQELQDLTDEAEKNELSTFDLMTRIMSYHRKGIPFVTLFTEVNLVRRTSRRLVASILSAYYAFYQRPKTAVWQFDEKKVDQGFKKAKKKYVRKG
ncbi:MAG TPA: hypothetical protein VGK34_03160 [Armatimonadota bacterium]|jgi:hypothetical protein